MNRGDVCLVDLDPTVGHEQAGQRPILVVQNDVINRGAQTVVIVPFTTQLRRAILPTCHLVRAGDGGLNQDSVALCHQIRVLDSRRLGKRLGTLSLGTMNDIGRIIAFTLDL